MNTDIAIKLNLPMDPHQAESRGFARSTCQLVVAEVGRPGKLIGMADMISAILNESEATIALAVNPFKGVEWATKQIGVQPERSVVDAEAYVSSGKKFFSRVLSVDTEAWYFIGSTSDAVGATLERLGSRDKAWWKFSSDGGAVIPAAAVAAGLPVVGFSSSHLSIESLGPDAIVVRHFELVRSYLLDMSVPGSR